MAREGRTEPALALQNLYDMHHEARKALDLFREAAEREAATAELARKVLSFLFRAQHNPALSFAAWTTRSAS